MKMVKDANPMLEDIRQPMEGPHVKEKREAIANETSHYRDGTVYKRGVGHVKVRSPSVATHTSPSVAVARLTPTLARCPGRPRAAA